MAGNDLRIMIDAGKAALEIDWEHFGVRFEEEGMAFYEMVTQVDENNMTILVETGAKKVWVV